MWKEILRITGIVVLAITFYKTDINTVLAFTALLALVIWGIPYAITLIFGLDKQDYDGVIYIQAMSDDSTDLKLDIYDKPAILEKTELLIKCDIPDILEKEDEA